MERPQSDWHSVDDSDVYMTHSDGVEHRAHEKDIGGGTSTCINGIDEQLHRDKYCLQSAGCRGRAQVCFIKPSIRSLKYYLKFRG